VVRQKARAKKGQRRPFAHGGTDGRDAARADVAEVGEQRRLIERGNLEGTLYAQRLGDVLKQRIHRRRTDGAQHLPNVVCGMRDVAHQWA
jgi:hypothetical protein